MSNSETTSGGRKAIVVGGAGGIGGDICRRLALAGYRVVVADCNEEHAHEVLGTLRGGGHSVSRLDVTKDTEVDATFKAIEAEGPASVLVVASGGAPVNPNNPHPSILNATVEEWNRSVALNLSGVFFCVRKFAQQRVTRPLEHTRIITITSASGQVVRSPASASYVSSKAAVVGFTRQVAFDLAHANITVNTISPGVVGTPEFLHNTTEEFRTQAASATLLNRLGTPEEIGIGVVFLASPEASYITGTTLDINGGIHMH